MDRNLKEVEQKDVYLGMLGVVKVQRGRRCSYMGKERVSGGQGKEYLFYWGQGKRVWVGKMKGEFVERGMVGVRGIFILCSIFVFRYSGLNQ